MSVIATEAVAEDEIFLKEVEKEWENRQQRIISGISYVVYWVLSFRFSEQSLDDKLLQLEVSEQNSIEKDAHFPN